MRSLESRLASIRSLQQKALALASRNVYMKTKREFVQFCCHIHRKPRYKPSRLLLFLEELYWKGRAPSTLRSAASAIAHFARLKGVHDLSSDPGVLSFLAGVERERAKPDVRRPFTIGMLSKLAQFWQRHEPDHAPVWIAISSLAFFGMLRISELVPRTLTHRHHAVSKSAITLSNEYLTLELSSYKHNRKGFPTTLQLNALSQPEFKIVCPVQAVSYVLCSPSVAEASPDVPLFPTTQSKVRKALLRALKGISCTRPENYTFHSFRIGGASHFAALGWDEGRIRRFGRWSSTAFMRYIRQC